MTSRTEATQGSQLMTEQKEARSVELKPCPFCGSSNIDPHGWASTESTGPACDDCAAIAGRATASWEHNVAAWNRRASTAGTLAELRAANIARQEEWCPDQKPDLSFRGNELAGEAGEACNVIKKLERERHGWAGSRATVEDLADELADVVICADLAAIAGGVDLQAAVLRKFNATSEKVGLKTRLSKAWPHPAEVNAVNLAANALKRDEAVGALKSMGVDTTDEWELLCAQHIALIGVREALLAVGAICCS